MRIGIDAYFAFHYKTGVAHYSRNLVNSLAKYYPEVELVLFTDKQTELYNPVAENISIVEVGGDIPYPEWLENERLHSAIAGIDPDIFHGMDHGLPPLQNIKSVVTVHDLFFESHPELYSPADVLYYRKKTPLACRDADVIISISEFTKNELISRYDVNPGKISTCYQSCNPLFFQAVPDHRKNQLRKDFNLPEIFWLYVGSVIERKNLLNICKALNNIRDRSTVPLVVIGEGGEYLQQVQDYVSSSGLEDRVRFLSYTETAKRSLSFQQAKDVPAFHQMALSLLYPSYMEGFGIPLIEAFASGLPVLTAATSSLPEIGGDAAMYIDPFNVNDIANALLRLETGEPLRRSMISRGKAIAQQFTEEASAAAVLNVYNKLL